MKGLKPKLYKCFSCNLYTLELKCPKCGKDTENPCPPKFPVLDKYMSQRLEWLYGDCNS
ncbi:MAG: nucleolar RNA-binding Nop10p family protein [archaeon]